MTWFRVDDGFPDHPKLEALEHDPKRWAAAVSLWLTAGCDCAKRGTDGVIVLARIERISRLKRHTKRAISDLVSVGLWSKTTTEMGPGFVFKDWSDYNPTAEETKRKRELANERQRRRRSNVTRDIPRDVTRDPSRARAFPVPSPPPIVPQKGTDISDVWDHYVCQRKAAGLAGAPAKLSNWRPKVRARLKGHTVEQLKQAIDHVYEADGFYVREGFTEVELTDGAGNDEGLPDVRLVWHRNGG